MGPARTRESRVRSHSSLIVPIEHKWTIRMRAAQAIVLRFDHDPRLHGVLVDVVDLLFDHAGREEFDGITVLLPEGELPVL